MKNSQALSLTKHKQALLPRTQEFKILKKKLLQKIKIRIFNLSPEALRQLQ